MGSLVHLASLKNATWLQSIESKGAKTESVEGIMSLIRLEAETRNPLHCTLLLIVAQEMVRDIVYCSAYKKMIQPKGLLMLVLGQAFCQQQKENSVQLRAK